MANNTEKLSGILSIARETSMRGEGISLREALRRTHYLACRADFAPGDLIPLLEANPQFIEDWLMYSCDKRCSGGWYLTEDAEIGQIGGERYKFESMVYATAEYVVSELDQSAGYVST
ncbi:MAG: hypothetical protein AAFX44_18130 [Pseudomonadota bacterium]